MYVKLEILASVKTSIRTLNDKDKWYSLADIMLVAEIADMDYRSYKEALLKFLWTEGWQYDCHDTEMWGLDSVHKYHPPVIKK